MKRILSDTVKLVGNQVQITRLLLDGNGRQHRLVEVAPTAAEAVAKLHERVKTNFPEVLERSR